MGLLASAEMRRVLANRRKEGRIYLEEGETHHLTRVLRLREGEAFEAILPPSSRFRCRLSREEGEWIGTILEESSTTWEAPLRICLAQALIKKEKFEWVVQKAVELEHRLRARSMSKAELARDVGGAEKIVGDYLLGETQ